MAGLSDMHTLGVRLAQNKPPLTNALAKTSRKSRSLCVLAIWSMILMSVAPVRAQGCDPNYSPCVPVARDVDCAAGSGNGPAYVVGPVTVIGSDIYDLDRDGDGIGCE
jgi:hypothetical protein